MPFIPYVDYNDLDLNAKSLFDEQLKKNGKVTNMKKTLFHSTSAFLAYQEWYPLEQEIEAFIGERAALLFSHAISAGNDCLLCSAYFRKALFDRGENPDELKLDEKEAVLVEFGRAIAVASDNIEPEVYEKLGKLFSKSEIVKLAAFAGIMAATNIFNNVLKIELDDYLEGFENRKPISPEK